MVKVLVVDDLPILREFEVYIEQDPNRRSWMCGEWKRLELVKSSLLMLS